MSRESKNSMPILTDEQFDEMYYPNNYAIVQDGDSVKAYYILEVKENRNYGKSGRKKYPSYNYTFNGEEIDGEPFSDAVTGLDPTKIVWLAETKEEIRVMLANMKNMKEKIVCQNCGGDNGSNH